MDKEKLEPYVSKEKVQAPTGTKVITMYLCPTCGNQIGRTSSKYGCKFCKQPILWPNMKKDGDLDERDNAKKETGK